MPELMIGVSGIRGVYGEGLNVEIAEKFAYSFGKIYSSPVVVGRDSRRSGKVISRAVISGLIKAGADVIDIGLSSTPTTEMAVVDRNASGGIIITASHNPGEWNGLKFLGSNGIFLDSVEGARVLEIYRSEIDIGKIPERGTLAEWGDADRHHIDTIMTLDIIDSEFIKSQKFKVCLDAVNGAGGVICSDLLERLGCEICTINAEPTGDFPHGAEPVPENIQDLCELVKDKKADIGFAVDPDVDRLSIVNSRGEAIGEEYTLALAVDYLMENHTKIASCNLSTSRMIDDIAKKHGGMVYRSPVGEINVVNVMRDVNAGIGGEGNGGVILPALHYGRDAVLGMAIILQFMAEKACDISSLADSIPKYSMIKKKMKITEKGKWLETLKAKFKGEEMDLKDGIKIIFPDSWIHVRASNTEPIVRVIAEARTEDEAEKLFYSVHKVIG